MSVVNVYVPSEAKMRNVKTNDGYAVSRVIELSTLKTLIFDERVTDDLLVDMVVYLGESVSDATTEKKVVDMYHSKLNFLRANATSLYETIIGALKTITEAKVSLEYFNIAIRAAVAYTKYSRAHPSMKDVSILGMPCHEVLFTENALVRALTKGEMLPMRVQYALHIEDKHNENSDLCDEELSAKEFTHEGRNFAVIEVAHPFSSYEVVAHFYCAEKFVLTYALMKCVLGPYVLDKPAEARCAQHCIRARDVMVDLVIPTQHEGGLNPKENAFGESPFKLDDMGRPIPISVHANTAMVFRQLYNYVMRVTKSSYLAASRNSSVSKIHYDRCPTNFSLSSAILDFQRCKVVLPLLQELVIAASVLRAHNGIPSPVFSLYTMFDRSKNGTDAKPQYLIDYYNYDEIVTRVYLVLTAYCYSAVGVAHGVAWSRYLGFFTSSVDVNDDIFSWLDLSFATAWSGPIVVKRKSSPVCPPDFLRPSRAYDGPIQYEADGKVYDFSIANQLVHPFASPPKAVNDKRARDKTDRYSERRDDRRGDKDDGDDRRKRPDRENKKRGENKRGPKASNGRGMSYRDVRRADKSAESDVSAQDSPVMVEREDAMPPPPTYEQAIADDIQSPKPSTPFRVSSSSTSTSNKERVFGSESEELVPSRMTSPEPKVYHYKYNKNMPISRSVYQELGLNTPSSINKTFESLGYDFEPTDDINDVLINYSPRSEKGVSPPKLTRFSNSEIVSEPMVPRDSVQSPVRDQQELKRATYAEESW